MRNYAPTYKLHHALRADLRCGAELHRFFPSSILSWLLVAGSLSPRLTLARTRQSLTTTFAGTHSRGRCADCGFQLRADDPSALKDIILGIQERVNILKKERMYSHILERAHFFVLIFSFCPLAIRVVLM